MLKSIAKCPYCKINYGISSQSISNSAIALGMVGLLITQVLGDVPIFKAVLFTFFASLIAHPFIRLVLPLEVKKQG